MKTTLIIWGVLLLACIIEAFVFTELDPESKEYLDNRKKTKNK